MIQQPLRKFENIHIILWLLKDICWIMQYKTMGTIMIIPTILLACWITIKSKPVLTEFMHNIAVTCWITANSIWMISELFFDNSLHNWSKSIFSLGLLVLVYHYFFQEKIWKKFLTK